MTRTGMLLWSAASGAIVGLLIGVLLLALVTLCVHVIPGIPERLVERLRVPTIVLLLAVIPLVAGILGYIEGRAKL